MLEKNLADTSDGSTLVRIRSLTDQTLHGFVWVFAGTGAQAVLKLSVTIVLARLISPGEFGTVGAALVVIGLCQVFSELGLAPAIIQRFELTDTHLRVAFTLALTLGVITGLSVYYTAPLISTYFRLPDVDQILRVMALTFPISSLGTVAEALLRRRMKFKQLSAFEVLSFTLGFCMVGIIAALLGWGVWALVAAQVAQTTVYTILLIHAVPHPKSICLEKIALGQLLYYGFGFSLARLGTTVALEGDNFVVARLLGAESLGIYGRAYQFMMLPTNLFGRVIDSVLFPSMASVQKDPVRLARAYLVSVGIVAMITLPLSGVLYVLASEIIHVLLGPNWDDVVVSFQIFATVLVFRTSYKLSDTLVRATGAVYSRVWRQWIYALLIVLGSSIGSAYGLGGVAVGVSIAIVVNFFLMLNLCLRLASLKWSDVAAVFLRHTLGSAPVIATAWSFAIYARQNDWNDLATACGTIMCAGLAFMVNAFVLSKFYGEEARLLVQSLRKTSVVLRKNRSVQPNS